ncbi:hypothetical protein MZM54_04250 [[Brevibacterium] frigoritolerans]|nr:hypothetical protein [Peribacillus frigoritolerans]
MNELKKVKQSMELENKDLLEEMKQINKHISDCLENENIDTQDLQIKLASFQKLSKQYIVHQNYISTMNYTISRCLKKVN